MAGLSAPAGDAYSIAEAVNLAGQIVKDARPSTGSNQAFLYSNGTTTGSGMLPGDTISEALGINGPRPGGRVLRRGTRSSTAAER